MKKFKYSLFIILPLVLLVIILFIFFKNSIFNATKDTLSPTNSEISNSSTKYDIPKIYFLGNISEMLTKEDERKILLRYEDGINDFEAYTSIKIQGSSSIAYEKKNYTIKLYEDYSLTEKKEVDLGWGAQNKYCLKANWIDKTHSRNIVTAQLASEIQKKYNLLSTAPNNGLIDGFPVEIYINDEFLGIYTWNIPKDAWMFNMDENNKNHIVFVGENWEETVHFKAPATYGPWDIEVGRGDASDLDKLNRLIEFVNNSSDDEFKNNYHQYLNLDATINYLILMEFASLEDNAGKNMLLATYDGNVWYPSLYDLDTSWGTNYNGLSTINYTRTNFINGSKLWKRTLDNFPEEVYNRYIELRKDILTKEHIMDLFNEFKNTIPEDSFKKEANRWNNIPGYDYTQIQDFLDVRIPLMDKFFEKIKINN
ncbi:MAG: CotH kinase family protein [Clostridia bacterium]|nr:CotH kinase family protein [Clostridia bacterium]